MKYVERFGPNTTDKLSRPEAISEEWSLLDPPGWSRQTNAAYMNVPLNLLCNRRLSRKLISLRIRDNQKMLILWIGQHITQTSRSAAGYGKVTSGKV